MAASIQLRIGSGFENSGWTWLVPSRVYFTARLEDDITHEPISGATGVRFYLEFDPQDGRAPLFVDASASAAPGEWLGSIDLVRGSFLRVQAVAASPALFTSIRTIQLRTGGAPPRTAREAIVLKTGQIVTTDENQYLSGQRVSEAPLPEAIRDTDEFAGFRDGQMIRTRIGVIKEATSEAAVSEVQPLVAQAAESQRDAREAADTASEKATQAAADQQAASGFADGAELARDQAIAAALNIDAAAAGAAIPVDTFEALPAPGVNRQLYLVLSQQRNYRWYAAIPAGMPNAGAAGYVDEGDALPAVNARLAPVESVISKGEVVATTLTPSQTERRNGVRAGRFRPLLKGSNLVSTLLYRDDGRLFAAMCELYLEITDGSGDPRAQSSSLVVMRDKARKPIIVTNRKGELSMRLGDFTIQQVLARLPTDIVRAVNGSARIDTLLTATDDLSDPRSGKRWAVLVKDSAGKPLIVADRFGKLDLQVSPALATRLAALLQGRVGAGNFLPDTALLGSYSGAYNVRLAPSGLRMATVQAPDQTVFPVVQRTDTTSTTALMAGPGPVPYLPGVGQSNAGPSVSPGINTLVGKVFPHHGMTAKERSGIGATTVLDPMTLTDIAPQDPTIASGITPAVGAQFAREALFREKHNRAGPGSISFVTNNPGQPITTIMPGTQNYTNAMGAAGRFKDLTALYGRRMEIPWWYFIQGETFSSNYPADLATAIDGYTAGFQAVTGQAVAPQCMLVQINGSDTASSGGTIQLAHYTFCRARYGQGVNFVTPMYYAPFAPPDDVIHQTAVGIMMRSEYLALTMEAIDEGRQWVPFWPVMANPVTKISDTIYDIEMTLPVSIDPGMGNGGWVKPIANYGVAYAGTDSGTVSVVSVAQQGTNKIRVTLSAKPTATDRRFAYARGFDDPVADLWPNTRGQIMTRTGRTSPFWRMGQPVPQYINLYCAAFEEAIP